MSSETSLSADFRRDAENILSIPGNVLENLIFEYNTILKKPEDVDLNELQKGIHENYKIDLPKINSFTRFILSFSRYYNTPQDKKTLQISFKKLNLTEAENTKFFKFVDKISESEMFGALSEMYAIRAAEDFGPPRLVYLELMTNYRLVTSKGSRKFHPMISCKLQLQNDKSEILFQMTSEQLESVIKDLTEFKDSQDVDENILREKSLSLDAHI